MKNLWIYAFTKPLSQAECDEVKSRFEVFVSAWKVHGKPASGSFFMRYNQFLFLHNSNDLSGCSIDSSTQILKDLKQENNLDALNSANRLFYRDSSNQITWVEKYLIETKLKEKEINQDSIIFNNKISTLESFDNGEWEIPLKNSWVFNKYENLFQAV